MNLQAEYKERLAERRRAQIGTLSPEAFEELRQAVAQHPDEYLEAPEDKAFKCLCDLLAKEDMLSTAEDFMDDEAFEEARKKRYERLRAGSQAVLELDPDCLDARMVMVMTSNEDANDIYRALREERQLFEAAHPDQAFAVMGEAPAPLDDEQKQHAKEACSATSIFMQPYIRLLAACARWSLNTTRYREACTICKKLIAYDTADSQGARFTLAISLARLEDEAGFNALDARFARQGNAWSHIARALLMFKLDRMSAARRALRSFDNLCTGGAFALLRPVYVEPYLLMRPAFEPGTFEEAVLAVHECDPVIMDTPDFLGWCQSQSDFMASAERFAQNNDLEW